MKPFSPFSRRAVILMTLTLCVLLFLLSTYRTSVWDRRPLQHFSFSAADSKDSAFKFDGKWNYFRDHKNLHLNNDQCNDAFDGLFTEINIAVQHRLRSNGSVEITLAHLDAIRPVNGYIRGLLYDGELYVIAAEGSIYSRGLATLHALYRAVVTSPTALPDIEFVFNADDKIDPTLPQWAYARRPADVNLWLMPDFGYWSWPETKVGSYSEVQAKAIDTETRQGWSWDRKMSKLLWRGATMGLELRQDLLVAATDKDWADVKALNWHSNSSMTLDLMSMSEHCRYKYLAHTEGNSYSGRLKYLQNCESVVVAHDMDWIQHHHPLLCDSGPLQNYVRVHRNFSNLEETVQMLIAHDDDAARIARNSVQTFRQRYLTPAAETCYWRALIRAWAGVLEFKPNLVDEHGRWRGVPIESFFLERRVKWDPY